MCCGQERVSEGAGSSEQLIFVLLWVPWKVDLVPLQSGEGVLRKCGQFRAACVCELMPMFSLQ